MVRFCYPVKLSPDKSDGGYVVTFRDIPEAITQGDTVDEALEQAVDALEEAIAGRIRRGEDIPIPSEPTAKEHAVVLPIATATKASLYMAVRESGLSKVQLAAKMGIDEKEVRRLVDPYHPSKLPRIEEALQTLGKRLIVTVQSEEEVRSLHVARA
jgi:antitoxin HicB